MSTTSSSDDESWQDIDSMPDPPLPNAPSQYQKNLLKRRLATVERTAARQRAASAASRLGDNTNQGPDNQAVVPQPMSSTMPLMFQGALDRPKNRPLLQPAPSSLPANRVTQERSIGVMNPPPVSRPQATANIAAVGRESSIGDTRDRNPYAYRADEIGPFHRIPGLTHLGNLLQPFCWKEGEPPVSKQRAEELYQISRAIAQESLRKQMAELAVHTHLPAEEQQSRNNSIDQRWTYGLKLDRLLLDERVKIFQDYNQRQASQLANSMALGPNLATASLSQMYERHRFKAQEIMRQKEKNDLELSNFLASQVQLANGPIAPHTLAGPVQGLGPVRPLPVNQHAQEQQRRFMNESVSRAPSTAVSQPLGHPYAMDLSVSGATSTLNAPGPRSAPDPSSANRYIGIGPARADGAGSMHQTDSPSNGLTKRTKARRRKSNAEQDRTRLAINPEVAGVLTASGCTVRDNRTGPPPPGIAGPSNSQGPLGPTTGVSTGVPGGASRASRRNVTVPAPPARNFAYALRANSYAGYVTSENAQASPHLPRPPYAAFVAAAASVTSMSASSSFNSSAPGQAVGPTYSNTAPMAINQIVSGAPVTGPVENSSSSNGVQMIEENGDTSHQANGQGQQRPVSTVPHVGLAMSSEYPMLPTRPVQQTTLADRSTIVDERIRTADAETTLTGGSATMPSESTAPMTDPATPSTNSTAGSPPEDRMDKSYHGKSALTSSAKRRLDDAEPAVEKHFRFSDDTKAEDGDTRRKRNRRH